MCMWVGDDEDLEFCHESTGGAEDGFMGCPNCHTDACLVDIIDDKPVTTQDVIDYATDHVVTECDVIVENGQVMDIRFTLNINNKALKALNGLRVVDK